MDLRAVAVLAGLALGGAAQSPARTPDIHYTPTRQNIAEAMLSGVPVIATETEGAREIFGSSEVGVLVPVGSPDDLAKAIIELVNDPTKRDAYATAGREHVEKDFSIEGMIDKTEALYRQVLDMP